MSPWSHKHPPQINMNQPRSLSQSQKETHTYTHSWSRTTFKYNKSIEITDIKENRTYPTCNDNPSNNRNKGSIGNPSLSLKGGQIGKDSSEKGCGCPNRLVEGHSEVPEGDVATHHRGTEDKAQRCNLHELGPRFDHLLRHHLEEHNGDIAENSTG